MTSEDERRPKPAEMLEGVDLGNGWTVLRHLSLPKSHTGGFFSYGYVVEHEDGREGYLKALDFFDPLYYSEDPAGELLTLTESFVYERELLKRCATGRLSRVVRSLDHGTVRVDGFGEGVVSTVQYLIFELAEGDVRSKLDLMDEMGLAWALRSLHHVANGLRQLHSIKVAHQDLKPSNVLLFDEGSSSKVGDLGRASHRDVPAPHDENAIVAGARAYAPPELLYGAPPADWRARRFGCDAYLMGSMVVFFFTGLSATALLMKHMPEELHYLRWAGTYEDILPHLQQAFGDMLAYLEPNVPELVREVLMTALRELCEPDPAKRGHPKNRRGTGNPYSLERYVSRFNVAARRAEIHLMGIEI